MKVINKDIIQFNNFLKENGTKGKFHKRFNQKDKEELNAYPHKTLIELFNSIDKQYWISFAFSWGAYPNGENNWSILDLKWRETIELRNIS